MKRFYLFSIFFPDQQRAKQDSPRRRQVAECWSVPVTIACRPKLKEINNQIVKERSSAEAQWAPTCDVLKDSSPRASVNRPEKKPFFQCLSTLSRHPTLVAAASWLFLPLCLQHHGHVEPVPLSLNGYQDPLPRLF